MFYKDRALLTDAKCRILGSFKNNQAELKGWCYAVGMEDALMLKLDCTPWALCLFIDKNISGSSVDESVVWLSVFAFFPKN